QQILKSTKKFPKKSILLYSVSPADQLHGYNFDSLQNCKCVVVLFTGAFLDNLSSLDLQAALQRVLCPPHRVVALLCGVEDDHVLTECFPDWPYWRKLYTEDEPAVYVSTILESRGGQAEREEGQSNTEETGATDLSCLTVQPNRIHCGETVFIIFKYKIDHYSEMEIEFSSESGDSTRIQPTVENSFTLSVTAPGNAILKPVTYFTSMGEVNHFIENATDPVNFICQAFHLQSNSRESLDHMLTECLKSKMPATGLQLFGIRQIEEDNMASYQRNEELPTLLHFAAKYGLKKLTTALLQCPGALQAYSVMNKNGDYPNTLAQKSGFSDLRQFMDEFVETADMLKSHIEETIAPEEEGDVYERMTTASQDMLMRFSGQSEDIYESMLEISPECAEDLSKPQMAEDPHPPSQSFVSEERENLQPTETDRIEEEEEDPYNLTDQIYDTVDPETMYPSIINRPPAPVPRPQPEPSRDQDKPEAYISRGVADARPPSLNQGSVYDPYAGMKTPGQRQLISLQERVKVGEISVEEAVQEFKAWQFDHERRAHSIRYQQVGRGDHLFIFCIYVFDYVLYGLVHLFVLFVFSCGVYEPTPRLCTMPPPTVPSAAATGNVIKRGSWKTGSTSSTSSESEYVTYTYTYTTFLKIYLPFLVGTWMGDCSPATTPMLGVEEGQ
uniref:DBB domain-containing protein n=1 Tax=Periophthalmus magnuspinnatus TaxID=409849 RepID=A0A3B4A2W3_9GOBI